MGFNNIYSYNLKEDYFSLEESPFLQDVIRPTIEQYLPDLSDKTVCDIKMGTGFLFKILLHRNFKSYAGFELNPEFTSHVNELITERRAEATFSKESIACTSFSDSFDIVMSTSPLIFEHYSELLEFCRNCYSITKKTNGVFFLVYPHGDFIHTKERIGIIEFYDQYWWPKLKEGENYVDFQKIDVILLPPTYGTSFKTVACIISQNTLLKALNEAGFTSIESLDMVASPGNEKLLAAQKAANFCYYRCKS